MGKATRKRWKQTEFLKYIVYLGSRAKIYLTILFPMSLLHLLSQTLLWSVNSKWVKYSFCPWGVQSSWGNRTVNLCACVYAKLLQSCLTLCDPIDCSLPGFSVHGILQVRILEWVAILSSRAPSWPGIEPASLALSPAWQANSLLLSHQGSPSTCAFLYIIQHWQRPKGCYTKHWKDYLTQGSLFHFLRFGFL